MINFVFSTLLWSFALYGLFHFFIILFRTYYKLNISSDGIYVFIAVKNQEDKIEGFLKTLLFRILYGKHEDINNIFVVDLNSNDKTSDILNMLSSDYAYINFTSIEKCIDILNKAQEKK